MKSHYCATKKEVYKLLFNYHIILCKKDKDSAELFFQLYFFIFLSLF